MEKIFDLYAVGNALVDFEFEVSDEALKTLNIDKGVMTLIDESTHHRLIDDLDGTKHAKACGGSAANSIITAQLLGAKTFYSCKVSNDATGNFFYQELLAQNVQSNLDTNNRPDGVTGKCIVLLTPDAERSMCTHLGISEHLSIDNLREEAIAQSKFLYFEGYLATTPNSKATAIKAKQWAEKHGAKTSMTLSDPNIVNYFKQDLRDMATAKIDLLFCNEKEALLFCDSKNLEAVKEDLQQYARTFAITFGAKGSLVFDGKNFHHTPASNVKVIDTLGAGDTFAGAFTYALTQNYSYQEANTFANIAAGQLVSKFGPRINAQDAKAILSAHSAKSA